MVSDWSCDKCTLDNPPTEAVCAACGTARPAPTSGWVCQVGHHYLHCEYQYHLNTRYVLCTTRRVLWSARRVILPEMVDWRMLNLWPPWHHLNLVTGFVEFVLLRTVPGEQSVKCAQAPDLNQQERMWDWWERTRTSWGQTLGSAMVQWPRSSLGSSPGTWRGWGRTRRARLGTGGRTSSLSVNSPETRLLTTVSPLAAGVCTTTVRVPPWSRSWPETDTPSHSGSDLIRYWPRENTRWSAIWLKIKLLNLID